MRRVQALLTGGLLVVLGACGAGEGTDTTAASDDGGADSAAAVTTTTEPATEEELSLANYLPGYGPEDPEDQEEYFRNQELQVQEYVRDCMAEEGFEYIPYVPSHEGYGYEDWEATEEERRAEQGFGMAFHVLEEEKAEEYYAQFEEEWDETDDPNFAIVEAMSDTEREAYWYALHGDEVDMDHLDWEGAETEEEMMALEEEANRLWMEREWKGCMELGWAEVTGGDAVFMSFEEEFGNMGEDIWERTQADPRVVELDQDWAACMSETGYEFRDQQDMHQTLWEEFEQLVVWPQEGGDTTGTTVAAPQVEPVEQEDGSTIFVDPEGNEYTEEQMDEFWRPQYDEAALRAFMEKEIAIAVAEYSCSEGYWEAVGEVRKEYEAQWVGENRVALDAWKAGLEADE